jgi:RNA polymerase sigma factor (sigma-70 family)
MSESGLLRQLRAREHAAQQDVIAGNRTRLLALAGTLVSSSADARALVADVLTDFLFEYVDALDHERAIPAYLRMMTIRRARRFNQHQQRHRDISEREDLVDASPDPAHTADDRRWKAWLDDCLSALADKSRQLLRLHFGHDLSLSEIGGQLGVSKQAVGKTVQKSLVLLRRCLERKGAPIPEEATSR